MKWKSIEGYEGIYMVSENGDVMRDDSVRKPHILATLVNNSGYHTVNLSKNCKQKRFLVHRLVAKAFIPNPNNLSEVNHIDCNKNNNSVGNLEWVSRSENLLHAFKNGRKPFTEKQYVSSCNNLKKATLSIAVPIAMLDKNDKVLRTFSSITEATQLTNISGCHICNCCKGRRKTAGGFKWKYI